MWRDHQHLAKFKSSSVLGFARLQGFALSLKCKGQANGMPLSTNDIITSVHILTQKRKVYKEVNNVDCKEKA